MYDTVVGERSGMFTGTREERVVDEELLCCCGLLDRVPVALFDSGSNVRGDESVEFVGARSAMS
jgi:hypothetical protein